MCSRLRGGTARRKGGAPSQASKPRHPGLRQLDDATRAQCQEIVTNKTLSGPMPICVSPKNRLRVSEIQGSQASLVEGEGRCCSSTISGQEREYFVSPQSPYSDLRGGVTRERRVRWLAAIKEPSCVHREAREIANFARGAGATSGYDPDMSAVNRSARLGL